MDKIAVTAFPYRPDAKGQLFPLVPLRFYFARRIIDTSALVDSGATISVFRAEVAKDLELSLEQGEEIYLGGVGGHIKGYVHKIKVEIAGKTFTSPIVFSHEYLVSFNLIGREEFFKRFKITFEEKKNLLKLE